MINLDQISDKFRKILNGADAETSSADRTNIEDLSFMVATEGVRFDSTAVKGENKIPVFIGQLGGTYNPVEHLEEADYSINVLVYFPLRFKETFHKLEGYLVECLVGKMLTWGEQKARSNISPAQYGEIEDLDLKELETWTRTVYNQKIEMNEKWCSLTFTLFLSTAKNLGQANGYIMGDQFSATITYDGNATEAEFAESSEKLTAEAESQQLLGTGHVINVASVSQYALSLNIYLKDDAFGRALLNDVIKKQVQGKSVSIQKTLSLSTTITDIRNYVILDASISYAKGELMTANLILGDE